MIETISFRCSACGSTQFQVPDSKNPKPDDMIVCPGCGASARYANLQATATQNLSDTINKQLRDGLRGAGLDLTIDDSK